MPPLAFNQVLNALVGQALGSDNKKMAGTWLQLSVFFLTTRYPRPSKTRTQNVPFPAFASATTRHNFKTSM